MLCVYVCVIPFILDDRLVGAPAGVIREEGHPGFLHLPSAVLALIFIARRIQSSFSLVDREVAFCVLTNKSLSISWAWKISVRVTAPRFELIFQRQNVPRLPAEPPGRAALYSCTSSEVSYRHYSINMDITTLSCMRETEADTAIE